MKKGDVINISTGCGVKQVEILSIGKKYITTTQRYKFHVDTLREVDGIGVSAYIIKDLDKYHKEIKRKKDEDTIRYFFRHESIKEISDNDLEKVLDIINNYN